MASLKAIKGKIRSIDKTRKVTKAMEAVSAAKMRKAQVTAIAGRGYAKAAVAILSRLSSSAELTAHPYLTVRPIKKALYVVITSDKGLAGGLNSGVLKATLADIVSLQLGSRAVSIVAIGKKANDFFSKRGFTVMSNFENAEGNIDRDAIERITAESLLSYQMNAADTVKVVFQSFISTFEQKPTVRTVLPFEVTELKKIVAEIIPTKGKFADAQNGTRPSTYEIEPSAEEILDTLIPRLASIFVYHALLESRASEHSARMVAMKSASDKARDLGKELTLDFNKARQAGITREVSEIIGGLETVG